MARVVLFASALGGFFLLVWALGPSDRTGVREQAERFFIAMAVPIVAVAWLYDPAVRWLDRLVYPDEERPSRSRSIAAEDETATRAERRVTRTSRPRPVSRRKSTPYVYAAATVLFAVVIVSVLNGTGLLDNHRAAETLYVFLVAGGFAALMLYDPILTKLDDMYRANR